MAPPKTGVSKSKTSKITVAQPAKKKESGLAAQKQANSKKQAEETTDSADKDKVAEDCCPPAVYLVPVIFPEYPPAPSAPCHPENKKEPPLHRAILGHRSVHAHFLIEKCGMTVNKKDKFGMAPLLLTCLLDDETYALSIAKLLYRHGADVNACDTQGRKALHHCCLQVNLDIGLPTGL